VGLARSVSRHRDEENNDKIRLHCSRMLVQGTWRQGVAAAFPHLRSCKQVHLEPGLAWVLRSRDEHLCGLCSQAATMANTICCDVMLSAGGYGPKKDMLDVCLFFVCQH
jgi:hypothetical protein